MIRNIVQYQVILPGGKEKTVDRAVGFIHGWDDKRIHKLTCHFHTKGRAIPENSISGGKVHLHYPIRIFGAVLDVFRNESPLIVVYDEVTGEGQIMTEHERVGKLDTDEVIESSNMVSRRIKTNI